MSWDRLPEEIQVLILSKLSYSDLESCRSVSRRLKKTVEENKRRLARRTVQLVKISCEEDEGWKIEVYSKEQRKRRILRQDQSCGKRIRLEEDSAIPLGLSINLDPVSCWLREAKLNTLELFEVPMTPSLLSNLSIALRGVAVETVDVAMCSLENTTPNQFLSFLMDLNAKNLRLSWLRNLRDDFSHSEGLLRFLKSREVLELVNLTDCEGKQLQLPLRLEDVLSCWSFHLDESCKMTQREVDYLAEIMSKGEGPRHARLECAVRPRLPPNSCLKPTSDERGFSLRVMKSL